MCPLQHHGLPVGRRVSGHGSASSNTITMTIGFMRYIQSLLQYHSSLHFPHQTGSSSVNCKHCQQRLGTRDPGSSEEKMGIWQSGVDCRTGMPSGRLVVGEDLLYIGAGTGFSSSSGFESVSVAGVDWPSSCGCASGFTDGGSVLWVVSWLIAVSSSTAARDAASAMFEVCEGKATGRGRLLILPDRDSRVGQCLVG